MGSDISLFLMFLKSFIADILLNIKSEIRKPFGYGLSILSWTASESVAMLVDAVAIFNNADIPGGMFLAFLQTGILDKPESEEVMRLSSDRWASISVSSFESSTMLFAD